MTTATAIAFQPSSGKWQETKQRPIFQSLSIPVISELLSKWHWSDLKTHLRTVKPAVLLDQLLNAGVDSDLVFRFFRWSQKELRLSYDLETTGKVLHFLTNSKRYSKVRSLLHSFVRNES
ncbi:hypothetical protein Lal_00016808 [Lupinus albus]|nr:hypothetical protein Lal_00016808 [Lupinus albus]